MRVIRFIKKMRIFRLVSSIIIGAILAIVERSLGLMIIGVSIIGTYVRINFAKKSISLLVETGTTSKLTFNFFGRFKLGIFRVLDKSPDHSDYIIECYD